jgi:DNA-binding MarR family transcriptional regulator
MIYYKIALYEKWRRTVESTEYVNEDWWSLVISLAELHQWELENHPLLTTLTGRHLYYRLAEESVKSDPALARALKDLFGGMYFTEKALRTRMRQMETDGLIQAVTSHEDARSKHLVPTEKFHELMSLHAEQVRKIFDKHFLLIEK